MPSDSPESRSEPLLRHWHDARSSRARPPKSSSKSGLRQLHPGNPCSKDDTVDVISVRMTDEIRDAFAALFDETFMQQLARGMRANPTTSTARCHVQVDCQQLAGDNCDVTGLAEYMIEVLSSAMSYPTGNRPGGRTAGYRLRLRWGADCGVHLRSAPRDARTLRKTARLFLAFCPNLFKHSIEVS